MASLTLSPSFEFTALTLYRTVGKVDRIINSCDINHCHEEPDRLFNMAESGFRFVPTHSVWGEWTLTTYATRENTFRLFLRFLDRSSGSMLVYCIPKRRRFFFFAISLRILFLQPSVPGC